MECKNSSPKDLKAAIDKVEISILEVKFNPIEEKVYRPKIKEAQKIHNKKHKEASDQFVNGLDKKFNNMTYVTKNNLV